MLGWGAAQCWRGLSHQPSSQPGWWGWGEECWLPENTTWVGPAAASGHNQGEASHRGTSGLVYPEACLNKCSQASPAPCRQRQPGGTTGCWHLPSLTPGSWARVPQQNRDAQPPPWGLSQCPHQDLHMWWAEENSGTAGIPGKISYMIYSYYRYFGVLAVIKSSTCEAKEEQKSSNHFKERL